MIDVTTVLLLLGALDIIYTQDDYYNENNYNEDETTPQLSSGPVLPCGVTDASQFYQNIEQLGTGYNIFKGNPMQQNDEGPQLKVFDVNNYIGCEWTGDRQKLKPDNVHISDFLSCRTEKTVDKMSTARDYQKEIGKSVKVETELGISTSAAGFSASFSASSEFKEVARKTSSHHTVYVVAESSCQVYEAELTSARHTVMEDFKKWVKKLAKAIQENDEKKLSKKLFRFVEKYGTHYYHKIAMGGKYGQITEFEVNKGSNQEYLLEKWRTGAKVSLTASLVTAGVGTEKQDSESVSEREEFEKASSAMHEYSYGSRPPPDGDARTWTQGTLNLVPISFDLRGIYEAVRPHNILSKDERQDEDTKKGIRKVHYRLKKYINEGEYCGELAKMGSIDSCKMTAKHAKDPSSRKMNKYCRFCKSCGKEYSEDGGIYFKGFLYSEAKHMAPMYKEMKFTIRAYADQCMDPFQNNLVETEVVTRGGLNAGLKRAVPVMHEQQVGKVHLCCAPENQCKACSECGGNYPVERGLFPETEKMHNYLTSWTKARFVEDVYGDKHIGTFNGVKGLGHGCSGGYNAYSTKKLCCQAHAHKRSCKVTDVTNRDHVVPDAGYELSGGPFPFMEARSGESNLDVILQCPIM